MSRVTLCPRFSAVIKQTGINPFVDVPEEVSAFFGTRRYLPIKGYLNGVEIRSTLVPIGSGRHRLFVNGYMRKRAGVGVGDTIEVILELDEEPRVVPMPEELVQALEENKEAKAVWESLKSSKKKEILAYLNWLKTPAARISNVKKITDFLIQQTRTSAKEGKGEDSAYDYFC